MQLPSHVVIERRDGRQEILLHRSMALISDGKVEIKSARSMVIIPALGLLIAGIAVAYLAIRGFDLPFWALIVILLTCLILVPFSVMGLISAIVGADVIVDKQKNSATWQQGYLGMGIGTKELVPFEKIAYLEVTIEGDQPDRWREQADALRQFALMLVKKNGKRLTLAQVPVPAYGQADGMDRTSADPKAGSWSKSIRRQATFCPSPKPRPRRSPGTRHAGRKAAFAASRAVARPFESASEVGQRMRQLLSQLLSQGSGVRPSCSGPASSRAQLRGHALAPRRW